jgi:uncharacterized protein (DUF2062 family)
LGWVDQGVTGGVFPIPGTTTLLCIALIWYFRLNIAATQLANLMCTPLWFMLVMPFVRAGEWLFQVEAPVQASELFDAMQRDFIGAVHAFAGSLLHAMVAWLLFTLVATPLLYHVLRVLLWNLSRSFPSLVQQSEKKVAEA